MLAMLMLDLSLRGVCLSPVAHAYSCMDLHPGSVPACLWDQQCDAAHRASTLRFPINVVYLFCFCHYDEALRDYCRGPWYVPYFLLLLASFYHMDSSASDPCCTMRDEMTCKSTRVHCNKNWSHANANAMLVFLAWVANPTTELLMIRSSFA